MLKMLNRKNYVNFAGPKRSVFLIREEGKISLYAGFIIKPHKEVTNQSNDNYYNKRNFQENSDKTTNPLLSVLNEVSNLKVALHRMFIPGRVKKKEDSKNQAKKDINSLIDEVVNENNQAIDVTLSFYIIKAWKEYDLSQIFLTTNEIVEDFNLLLRNELKSKLENTGKIGRLLDDTLEEFISYGIINQDSFTLEGNKGISSITKDYALIEKSEEFNQSFMPGSAVDIRPEGIFTFPSGIESDNGIILGLTENDKNLGFSADFSYPVLLAGDKKTREIITCRLLEQDRKFIILDPRSNLEFNQRIKADFTNLTLGKNFGLNILYPDFEKQFVSDQLATQYLSNFLDILRVVADARSDTVVLLRDLVDFYLKEYKEEREDILYPQAESVVTLDDLYTMLTIEPGGLVITDYQLSAVRSLVNEIRDHSISSLTEINGKREFQELFTTNKIIDFSQQGFKIQKAFLYSFLLQLTTFAQITDIEEEVIIYIDDAELFFSRDVERTILAHILKKLENSPFKLIFSTAYPSHLANSIYDLNQNRVIGNLKSARCLRLVSETHGLKKNQTEFIRRLPRNSFLIVREELLEKPMLLRFFPEDIQRHEMEPIARKSAEKIVEKDKQKEKISVDIEDFTRFHPIMEVILIKLSSKAHRGINTESLPKLFSKWSEENVKETITLLETFGYIFQETVDKKGKRGEYWTKITPRGKKFLEKLKVKEIIEKEKHSSLEEKSEIQQQKTELEEEQKELEGFIESPSITIQNEEKTDDKHIIAELQKIRKLVREVRDSTDEAKSKLDILHSILTKVPNMLDVEFVEESHTLEKFLLSLKDILNDEKALENIPKKVLERIFQKSLSQIDAIQLRVTFGNNNRTDDEEFLERMIDNELKTEKWQEFDKEVFMHEIPELSSLGKESSKVLKMIKSEYPDEVINALEKSQNLPKEEFIAIIKQGIASLLQIKTKFYPNMEAEEYLENVNSFFQQAAVPEPFEKTFQLLWEYSILTKNESLSSKKLIEARRKIIESIQQENKSFDFDLDEGERNSFVKQLITSIREKM